MERFKSSAGGNVLHNAAAAAAGVLEGCSPSSTPQGRPVGNMRCRTPRAPARAAAGTAAVAWPAAAWWHRLPAAMLARRPAAAVGRAAAVRVHVCTGACGAAWAPAAPASALTAACANSCMRTTRRLHGAHAGGAAQVGSCVVGCNTAHRVLHRRAALRVCIEVLCLRAVACVEARVGACSGAPSVRSVRAGCVAGPRVLVCRASEGSTIGIAGITHVRRMGSALSALGSSRAVEGGCVRV